MNSILVRFRPTPQEEFISETVNQGTKSVAEEVIAFNGDIVALLLLNGCDRFVIAPSKHLC